MKPALKQLLTITSVLSIMQMAWWGCWVDDTDYKYGTEIQQLTGQQITSENQPQEDLHFLPKEKVAKPIEATKK